MVAEGGNGGPEYPSTGRPDQSGKTPTSPQTGGGDGLPKVPPLVPLEPRKERQPTKDEVLARPVPPWLQHAARWLVNHPDPDAPAQPPEESGKGDAPDGGGQGNDGNDDTGNGGA